jgi:hypothetical protein
MMAKKTKSVIPPIEHEEKKPLCFNDYFKPSPFERPWMLPYLSSNVRVRDFTIVFVGHVLCLSSIWLLIKIGANEEFSAISGLLGVAFFQSESLSRNVIAGINFNRAKRYGKQ